MLFRRLKILIRYYKNICLHKMRRESFPEEKHGGRGRLWRRERIDSKLLGGIHERKEAQRRNSEHPVYILHSSDSSSGLFISARARIKSRLSFLFQSVRRYRPVRGEVHNGSSTSA